MGLQHLDADSNVFAPIPVKLLLESTDDISNRMPFESRLVIRM